ncbi:Clp protease ClpP [Cochleicola gelatinilyticus]|uniref:ATP-dependent Clp protease proteolytic subunit n=1 Tax=Cochleicola gelatinilyticus TaxID=1763537 RepID=A0A167HML0_9FLAO|nr:Clp protease ClpP [Cochleicola gelatinilyticus]OAB78774.1 hypothetical protein ULVI_09335 [Cochleicola gelatinilyticus]
MSKAVIFIEGEIGVDVELIDVVRQYKSFSNPTELEVIVNSPGGYVNVGKSIFQYLKNLQLPVTTIAKGMCASIASYIFFAGDSRKIYEDAEIMIHLPSGGVSGTAQNIEDYSKEMRALESELAEFYMPFFNLDKETVYSLLEQESWINSDAAMDMGIVDTIIIPLKAVAKFDNKNIDKKENMNKNEKTLFKAIKDYFTGTIEPKNLMVQDANGDEINFPELSADEVPVVRDGETAGSKAVDGEGKPIEGERTATNGDVWKFEAGELVEIVKAETEEEVTEEATEEETVDVVETEEETVDVEQVINTIIDGVTARLEGQFNDQFKTINTEITSIKKNVGSDEAEVEPTNRVNNTSVNKRTDMAFIMRSKK